MTALVLRLGRYHWLHKLVAMLRVYPIAEMVLRRVPLQRRLKPSGLVYRLTSLDQLSIEFGLFTLEEYGPALSGRPVETFIDLGCNAGWFALWLYSRAPDSRPLGLLVDAHPRMVGEASWHIQHNGLVNCHVVHGAVGVPPDQSSTRFHVHPSSSASSVFPFQPSKQMPSKGSIADVTVPAVSVASEWQRLFGDAAVDLMKVDIEGKELDLVIYEGEFLHQRVRRLVIEWHEWIVSLAQLDAQLVLIGFEQRGIFDQRDQLGVALYENSSLTG